MWLWTLPENGRKKLHYICFVFSVFVFFILFGLGKLLFIAGNVPLILKFLIIKMIQFCFLYVSCFFSLMHFYLQFHCWFFWTTFVTSIIFYCSVSFIVISIMNGNYNFFSNNVKGIKASEKQLKLFEYPRNNINNNGFIFLQETHLLSNDEQKWKDDFRGPLFISHRKSNSCGVAICYCGTEVFKVVNTACDKNEQILILNGKLNGTNFFLIHFYNSNTESEQLSTFSIYKNYLK